MKKYNWIPGPRGLLLVVETEYLQKDGMPATEDEIIGGVDTKNGYSMGWGMLNGQKRELLLRYEEAQAKDDVEEYLIFKGIMPLKPKATHEKSI